jgi:hypothetical protein
MKLKFFIKNEKKIYTLKEGLDSGEASKPAHYKFLKIRDAPKSNLKFVRKN